MLFIVNVFWGNFFYAPHTQSSGINQDRAFSVDVDLGDDKKKERQEDLDDDDNDKMKDDDSKNEIEGSGDKDQKSEPQDEFGESSSEPSEQPGGLVGLITNLSGVNYSYPQH